MSQKRLFYQDLFAWCILLFYSSFILRISKSGKYRCNDFSINHSIFDDDKFKKFLKPILDSELSTLQKTHIFHKRNFKVSPLLPRMEASSKKIFIRLIPLPWLFCLSLPSQRFWYKVPWNLNYLIWWFQIKKCSVNIREKQEMSTKISNVYFPR